MADVAAKGTGSGAFLLHGSAARRFLTWLERRRIPLTSVDDTAVSRFARHRCRCSRYSPRMLVCPEYVGGVRRFVRFMDIVGIFPSSMTSSASLNISRRSLVRSRPQGTPSSIGTGALTSRTLCLLAEAQSDLMA